MKQTVTDIKRKSISMDEWIETFDTVVDSKNELRMFNDTGRDLAEIMVFHAQHPDRVWTMIEGEEEPIIANGLKNVDRLGYFLTEKPAPKNTAITVI